MIRPVAVALIAYDGSLLLMRVPHPEKGVGYRPLGGTIEFGERGVDTVARELLEEVGATIANVSYVGTVESIFTSG